MKFISLKKIWQSLNLQVKQCIHSVNTGAYIEDLKDGFHVRVQYILPQMLYHTSATTRMLYECKTVVSQTQGHKIYKL